MSGLSGEVVLSFDEKVMAVRAGSTCLEVGDVSGVAHEGLGGFPGGPLDDDPQGCAFAFNFEAFVAGSPARYLPPCLVTSAFAGLI